MADNLLKRVEILLEANTAKFETGMAKAGKFANDTARTMAKGFGSVSSEVKDTQKQVNTLSQTFEKHDAEVKKIAKTYDVASIAVKSLSAMAAGVSVASLTSFANQYMEKANDIQKYAKLVGSSTQQFQYYAAGAEAAGVSMEKFADIGKDALDKLGDAKAGQGELMDFFNQIGPKIGVTIAQFKDLSGPEVIQKYYNGLKAANVSHAETVKFMEQIANDGSLLIPLLENGGQGFKKWGDAAKQANAIMSDEMIANLLVARENIKLLTLQWEGFQASLVNEIVPAVKILKDHTDELQATGIALGTYVGGALVIAIGKSTIAGYAKVKQIIEQISVQSTAIQLERAAATQELQTAQAKLASVESTMVALQAERALEIQRLKAQISAQGLAASQTRLAEISLIEAQVKTELTAANTALAASQTRVTVAQTATLGAGRSLLAVLGGPAGLAIFAASVAASFLLMKDNSDTAKDALEDQGLTVDELRKKYSKLNAEQLKLKSLDAAKEIEKQNQIIADSYKQLDRQVYSILTGAGTQQQANALQQYINDLKSGGEKAAQALDVLESKKVFTDSQIRAVADLGANIKDATGEVENQKKIQDIARQSTDKTVESQKKQITVLNETAKVLGLNIEQWGKLTASQQDYAKKVAADVGRQAYITENMKGGKMTREQAEFMAAQHESMGISFYTKFNQSQQQIANKAWAVTGNFTLTPEQRRAFSKVQQNAAKYNFSDKESFYGLPSGLLSAIMMNESRGDTYRNGKLLTSESGAQGSFQFLPKTAKRFGVDVTSVESSAAGAAKYLQYLYKRFGDWDSAIAAYHAGEGNVEKGTNIGPRTRNYVLNANKYVAAANGKSTVDTSLTSPSQAEALAQQAAVADAQKAIDDKRKEIDAQYYTEAEKLEKEHKDRVKSINQAYAGTKELKTRLSQEDALYKEQTVQLQVNREKELNQLKAFETDRITQIRQSYDQEIRLMKVSTKYFGADREEQIKLLERAKQSEIDAVKREEEQQVISAFEAYMNETEIVLKRYAIERDEIKKNYQLAKETREKLLQANSMKIFSAENSASNSVFQSQKTAQEFLFQKKNPNAYAAYDLQNQYSADLSGLNQAYANHNASIENNPLLDQQQRQQKLLAAHEEYLQSKQALDEQYAAKEKDLRDEQYTTQLNMYGSLLSQAGSVWGSMTDMVKESAGESSAAYKAMFLVQQMIAIGQAIINTEVAATKAMAEGGYIAGIPMAMAIRVMGYASVGVIAAQTVAGIAHGGMDYVPSESTFLLDKGERVLSPRQNQDLTTFLSERKQEAQQQTVQTNVQPQHIQVNNVYDPSLVGDYLGTNEGVKSVLNIMKRNRTSIKAIIG